MPVIRATNQGKPVASLQNQLVELLFKELIGKGGPRGPVVFEVPTDRPDTTDVIVIWDAWGHVPQPDRGAIIRDAYARYWKTLEQSLHLIDPSRPSPSLDVPKAIAVGATFQEALRAGLLPFSIQPMARPEETDADDLRRLMIECGAIQTPTGVQLRFPSAQMAADAHAQLEQEMPEGRWSIVEEMGSVADWTSP